MNRTKQVLQTIQIAAALMLLMPLIVWANSSKKDSSKTKAKLERLLLTPQTHLQLTTQPIWGDSVEAIVNVAVPDSCKTQRHICWFESNLAVRLSTVPRFKWALRRDSLMVLSSIPLQIRLARQNFAAAIAPFKLKIHYQNLDHAAKLSGVATIELLPDQKIITVAPTKNDSAFVLQTKVDNAQATLELPSRTATVQNDSAATATNTDSFGLFYVALTIVLIAMFGGLGSFITWSQRRRFQQIAAKRTATAVPHLQKPESAAAETTIEDTRPSPEEQVSVNSPQEIQETANAETASANLPAVVYHNNGDAAAAILSQLHDLKLSVLHVLNSQQEANQRLAQMAANTALLAARTTTQLALFDVLNDDSTLPNGGGSHRGNAQLRLQLADEKSAANLENRAATASSRLREEAENFPTSRLRLLFANAEEHDEAPIPINGNGYHAAGQTFAGTAAGAANDWVLH